MTITKVQVANVSWIILNTDMAPPPSYSAIQESESIALEKFLRMVPFL